ncbi:carcinoembryonic antigen-related cell adhesion molecule 8-like [Cololabis saira]|uniref:carcinoembryonic antigen-related cell adhesion molecule 8-like n=1 Tax=Cololabis saira TaxID=129043 RepID=UPI002AD3459C|nr:carcinoembryonic antigen-related cell adhesion molecule 8-like [Cololabis saira]
MTMIYLIILGTISGLCEADGVLPDGPLNASLGGTVMFTTTLTPSDGPYTAVFWKFGIKDIISYAPTVNKTPPEYEGRITLFPSTGSLELRDLTRNDSGEYGVNISPGHHAGRTRLDIYEPISGIYLTASTNLIIDRNSVNLTCDASGSPTARKWMKDGSDLILNDNMALSDNNTVLSFKPVNRDNSGDYLCTISNPVSSSEAKYRMDVMYGPENVRITGKDNVTVSEPIKLICSANSTPSATFIWMLNGTVIPANSPEFSKENAELSDGGYYTCEAMNNITDRRSSATFELFVHAGSIQPSGLSAGGIAGIVIVCLIITAAAAGGGYYFCRKKSNLNTDAHPMNNTENKENLYEEISAVYENVKAQ